MGNREEILASPDPIGWLGGLASSLFPAGGLVPTPPRGGGSGDWKKPADWIPAADWVGPFPGWDRGPAMWRDPDANGPKDLIRF